MYIIYIYMYMYIYIILYIYSIYIVIYCIYDCSWLYSVHIHTCLCVCGQVANPSFNKPWSCLGENQRIHCIMGNGFPSTMIPVEDEENLHRKPWLLHVTIRKFGKVFRCKFSHHPILWSNWKTMTYYDLRISMRFPGPKLRTIYGYTQQCRR